MTDDKPVPAEEEDSSSNKKKSGGLIGLLLVVLAKLKSFGFLGLKALKYGKSVLTMGLMIWTYSLNLGWPFATGFVLLILIHELGHGYAGKRLGYRMSAPVFIPFVGAFIALKDKPKNDFQNFVIGAGGPLAGTLGAVACLLVASQLDTGYPAKLLFALGFSALNLNLFNLMPIGFLDGGRMATPIAKWPWLVGYALLAGGYFAGISNFELEPNGIAMIVLVVGFIQLILKFRRKKKKAVSNSDGSEPTPESTAPIPEGAPTPEEPAPLRPELMSSSTAAAVVYFGLAGFLMALVQWFAP